MLDALIRARAEIIQPPKHDRFSRTDFGACRNQSALLAIITKRALERAARIVKRLRPAINYAKRARHNAIAAAVADIVLHQHRADFGSNDRSGRARLKATSFFAVLANVGQENPAE